MIEQTNLGASHTEENVLQETTAPEPNTPALPEDWQDPTPWESNETHEMDKIDGRLYPACHVCEWCHCRPVEYHERNHDRFLCKGCAFDVAPTRPIVERTFEHPFIEFEGDDYFEPEDLTFQLAKHTLALLALAKGIRYGYDWEDGSHSSVRRDTLFMLADFANQTKLTPVLPWDDLDVDNECLLETEFFPAIRESLVLLMNTNSVLDSLRSLCQAFDAPSPEQARKNVLKALRLATATLPYRGSTEDEKEPPKPSNPPTPKHRKKGGLL
jgi:hypothetical protein